MARATSSLPVPVSPRMSTVTGRGGHAPDFLVNGLHGAAVADDSRLIGPRFAHFHRLGHEPIAGHGFGDQIEQFSHIERLEQIVVSAEFGRFDGGFRGAEGGHQNDGQLGLGGVELRDQFQSGQSRHLQIGDDHIERLLFGLGQSFITSLSHGDFIALDLQFFFQATDNAGVVFNE